MGEMKCLFFRHVTPIYLQIPITIPAHPAAIITDQYLLFPEMHRPDNSAPDDFFHQRAKPSSIALSISTLVVTNIIIPPEN